MLTTKWAMVLQPGESTLISIEYNMHGAMGGLHDFRLMPGSHTEHRSLFRQFITTLYT